MTKIVKVVGFLSLDTLVNCELEESVLLDLVTDCLSLKNHKKRRDYKHVLYCMEDNTPFQNGYDDAFRYLGGSVGPSLDAYTMSYYFDKEGNYLG